MYVCMNVCVCVCVCVCMWLCANHYTLKYCKRPHVQLYPEEFEAFEAPIPQRERGDMMGAYYRYLTGDDEKKRQECASAWSIWEMTTSKLAVVRNVCVGSG
jgi:hypothetical protein